MRCARNNKARRLHNIDIFLKRYLISSSPLTMSDEMSICLDFGAASVYRPR
jgi:hypothetical protein